jgi:hypothetical protein
MKVFKVFYKYKDFELSASQNEFLSIEAAELFKKRYQATHKDDILSIKNVESWYFTPEHPERVPEPNTEKDDRVIFSQDFFSYDSARVGDLVNYKVVDDLLNSVPPLYYKDICQTSEPYSHTAAGPLYLTFKHFNNDFIFCGACYAGKTENKSDFYKIN